MAQLSPSLPAAAAQIHTSRRPAISRILTSPDVGLPPELIEGCRYASLQLGGPRLARLGVTSSVRGEGRSSIARALACIQAHDYQRSVVLLDLDLERPGLGTSLGAAPSPGVAELAEGGATVDEVLQPVGDGITLVTAGAPRGPLARTMAAVLRSDALPEIAARCDVLVADLPPLLSSVGQAPAGAFDDVLLVVRSGVTPLARIRQGTAHLPVRPKVMLNGSRSHLPAWLRHLVA